MYYPSLEQFLTQDKNEKIKIEDGYQQLTEILHINNSPEEELDEMNIKSPDDEIAEEVLPRMHHKLWVL